MKKSGNGYDDVRPRRPNEKQHVDRRHLQEGGRRPPTVMKVSEVTSVTASGAVT